MNYIELVRFDEDTNTVVLLIECPRCGSYHKVAVSCEEYVRLMCSDANISDILKTHSAVERDQLILGWCPDCWTRFYGEDDDD